jgi:hypothetical protein
LSNLRFIVLWAVLVVAGAYSLPSPWVEAGHSKQGSHCAIPQPWTMCRSNWGWYEYMRIRVIDNFSWANPACGWLADSARYNWHTASGPQLVTWYGQENDRWMYLNYAWTGQQGLTWDYLGMHWGCDTSGWCTNTGVAMVIWWSDIYINGERLPYDWYPDHTAWVFAHEIGHGLGLAHHDSYTLMNANYPGPIWGPTSTEAGNLPPCSGSTSSFGVRCVFEWPW